MGRCALVTTHGCSALAEPISKPTRNQRPLVYYSATIVSYRRHPDCKTYEAAKPIFLLSVCSFIPSAPQESSSATRNARTHTNKRRNGGRDGQHLHYIVPSSSNKSILGRGEAWFRAWFHPGFRIRISLVPCLVRPGSESRKKSTKSFVFQFQNTN